MKRSITSIAALGLIVVGSLVITQNALATPALPDKVTICHRTHAVNNPYRMITVSKSAIDGPLNVSTPSRNSNAGDHAGYVHNGVSQSGQHIANYPKNPKVFHPDSTSAFTAFDGTTGPSGGFTGYSGPNKVWQDIIPPFTGSDGKSYAGLNWNDEGKAIYFGTGVGTVGLCKKMSAKAYATSETAAGQSKNSIRDDLRDQKAAGDPTIPNDPTTLPDVSEDEEPKAGPTPPARLTDGTLTQAIGGKVWFDDNHNGVQDGSEQIAANVEVDLSDPTASVGLQVLNVNGGQLRPSRIYSAGMTLATAGTTIVAHTDADGIFYFTNVPEGEWTVTVVTPSGYRYTYDSAGASDGIAPTIVPAGSVGYMWAGLISNSAPWSAPTNIGGSTDSGSEATTGLSNTGQPVSAAIPAIALGLIGIGAITTLVVRRARRFREKN